LRDQLSGVRIAGVAVVLFSAVLLGVGIHHLVATGTCSSTGYSANFGPVPHCPSGTGWWFAFVFIGIIGGIAGAMMAGSMGLIFAGIFGAIGFGALSLVLDSHARSSTKVFGAAFGGVFALVGLTAAVIVLSGAVRALRGARGPRQVRYGKTKTSSRATPTPSPIPAPAAAAPTGSAAAMEVPTPTPLNLVPGLQAASSVAGGNAVDEISKLAALHQQGSLTDEEFTSAKAKLLGQL
jgi:hypothetical protein